MPVSRSLIKARAMFKARKQSVLNFQASDGWFWRWRWWFNISNSIRLHGEAGDVDLNEAENKIDELRNEIVTKGYKAENVFNMDETGLFYKAIPNRTYLVEGDKRQAGKGAKMMKAKDRITVILCTNSTGTCKLSPVVIGTSKKPRCFNAKPPSIPYFHQRSAWNDAELCARWWNEVFLKRVREWTQDPVALLIDGFSGHNNAFVDPLGQVQVIKLPPNTTSVLQPLDAGIISAFKAHYKGKLLLHLVSAAPEYDQLQTLATHLPSGCVGVKYRSPPHVGDAIELVIEAWSSVSAASIQACWKHASCLPPLMLFSMVSLSQNVAEEAEELAMELMRNVLSPSSGTATSNDDPLTEELSEWIHFEENTEIEADDDCNTNGQQDEDVPPQKMDVTKKIAEMKKVQFLLHSLHRLGAELEDVQLINTSRKLCVHAEQQLSRMRANGDIVSP